MTSVEWKEWWELQPWKTLKHEAEMLAIIADLAACEKERDEAYISLDASYQRTDLAESRVKEFKSTLWGARSAFVDLLIWSEEIEDIAQGTVDVINGLLDEPKEKP